MSFEINPFEIIPGWELIKSLYHYYGLKDYLNFWYHDTFDTNTIFEIEAYDFDNIQGDKIFWEKVLSGQFRKGQKLRLKNFQISSWFPRTPGQYWTFEAASARDYALKKHIESVSADGIVFDIYGKTLMTDLGGIGSVNFNKNRDFVLITATASGVTDEGIPIVCRKNVWEKIEEEFDKQNRIEIDIEGTLVNLNPENSSFFLRTAGVPRVAVLVNSILNIKIKASALKINACPWTIFQINDKYTPYGFTYKAHTIFEDDIDRTNTWLIDYVEEHGGDTILTDYDENRNYLNAIFPLNDVATGSIVDRELMNYLQKIYNAFKKQ
jgi:hypothetical protein